MTQPPRPTSTSVQDGRLVAGFGPTATGNPELLEKMLWEAFIAQNKIVPPFGGGGSAFRAQHAPAFDQFKQGNTVMGGRVVPRQTNLSAAPQPLSAAPAPAPPEVGGPPADQISVDPEMVKKLMMLYRGR